MTLNDTIVHKLFKIIKIVAKKFINELADYEKTKYSDCVNCAFIYELAACSYIKVLLLKTSVFNSLHCEEIFCVASIYCVLYNDMSQIPKHAQANN